MTHKWQIIMTTIWYITIEKPGMNCTSCLLVLARNRMILHPTYFLLKRNDSQYSVQSIVIRHPWPSSLWSVTCWTSVYLPSQWHVWGIGDWPGGVFPFLRGAACLEPAALHHQGLLNPLAGRPHQRPEPPALPVPRPAQGRSVRQVLHPAPL